MFQNIARHKRILNTTSPEKASKSLWILQLAQPVHFKAFRGIILWLGSHSSQSSSTGKIITTYYNYSWFGFLNVISSGLWWSTYGTFSKLTWPFWVQMELHGATWQHHLSKHIQTIYSFRFIHSSFGSFPINPVMLRCSTLIHPPIWDSENSYRRWKLRGQPNAKGCEVHMDVSSFLIPWYSMNSMWTFWELLGRQSMVPHISLCQGRLKRTIAHRSNSGL